MLRKTVSLSLACSLRLEMKLIQLFNIQNWNPGSWGLCFCRPPPPPALNKKSSPTSFTLKMLPQKFLTKKVPSNSPPLLSLTALYSGLKKFKYISPIILKHFPLTHFVLPSFLSSSGISMNWGLHHLTSLIWRTRVSSSFAWCFAWRRCFFFLQMSCGFLVK